MTLLICSLSRAHECNNDQCEHSHDDDGCLARAAAAAAAAAAVAGDDGGATAVTDCCPLPLRDLLPYDTSCECNRWLLATWRSLITLPHDTNE